MKGKASCSTDLRNIFFGTTLYDTKRLHNILKNVSSMVNLLKQSPESHMYVTYTRTSLLLFKNVKIWTERNIRYAETLGKIRRGMNFHEYIETTQHQITRREHHPPPDDREGLGYFTQVE